ncbi:MAG: C-terminal target protein [Bacteroidetes bacterium]|nr:C-terminal target protein [Bacteroidota bacterium]
MKKILLLWMSVVFLASAASAQCVGCVPSTAGCNPNGGICGHSVVGMANHPYTTNISFYMPKRLNDPAILSQCSCNEVDLHTIKITGVGGLPTGVNATFDHANQTYDVQAGDSLGCANFCGTPLAPGIYPITVYIEAHVLAVGTPIGNVDPGPQNQTYKDTMIILPDTSGAISSFNYTPHVKLDCDSLRLGFNALLSAPSPNPTSYEWNFGSGQTSTAVNPAGTYSYNTPGIHPVSLRTIFYQYRVKQVHVYTISGGYTGDIEELTTVQNPDPYIKFTSLGYTSGNVSDTKTNINYNNLNLLLPMGTSSTSMELWDADNGPPFGSQDDLIGTYNINIINGLDTAYWASGNASGFVVYDTVFANSFTDTLKVNIEGRPATPLVLTASDSLCKGDSTRMVITPMYSNVQYEWWRDSVFILAATDSVYWAKDDGNYRVRITNLATGCSTVSDTPYTKLNVSGPIPYSANVVYSNGNHTLFLNPFSATSYAEWYFNGTLITGQNGGTIPSLGPGVYKAVIYPVGFPQCSLTSADVTVTNVGITEAAEDIYDLSVFPNPNNGSFTLRANVITLGDVSVKIIDMLGRDVYQKTLTNQNGEVVQNIDISGLAKDVYTVQVSSSMGQATKRVVVK